MVLRGALQITPLEPAQRFVERFRAQPGELAQERLAGLVGRDVAGALQADVARV